MALDPKHIAHIADLAHLKLDEAEAEKFIGQLSSILDYVGKLSSLDTRGIEPTAHITGVADILREDVVKACDLAIRENLLNAAPEREGDYIKVKAVFGN